MFGEPVFFSLWFLFFVGVCRLSASFLESWSLLVEILGYLLVVFVGILLVSSLCLYLGWVSLWLSLKATGQGISETPIYIWGVGTRGPVPRQNWINARGTSGHLIAVHSRIPTQQTDTMEEHGIGVCILCSVVS